MKISNEDIKLKMKSLEEEYETKKNKIIELIHDLSRLDDEYIKLEEQLNKEKKDFI